MKLILREYLASLRERDELDAMLPSLVSELGFVVISRPGRGTKQHGVDVVAVGPHNGEEKLHLFCIKKGDIGRSEWNGANNQALRPSLDEVQDVYIPTLIPPAYRNHKVVVCICFGGDIKETVRLDITQYTVQRTTDALAFEEWNGDKLADLLLKGILREELLPKDQRSSFQKAVALLDEPDVAYGHFAAMAGQLSRSVSTAAHRVRMARQLYVCLWVTYVWARDIGNLEAAYRASELALLHVWDLIKVEIGSDTEEQRALADVLLQLVNLHVAINSEFMTTRIYPHTNTAHALTMAVDSRNSVDANLKLFEVLGRIALLGLWHVWAGNRSEGEAKEKHQKASKAAFDHGVALIESNPILALPVTDTQATEIALFLLLWVMSGGDRAPIASWLTELVRRLDFTIRTRSKYPIVSRDYRDLVGHPRERTDEYFKKNTAGSTLMPLVAAWLCAMGEAEAVRSLAKLSVDHLEHCTMQLWLYDESSEQHLYLDSDSHGRALADLPIDDGVELLQILSEATRDKSEIAKLSAVTTDYWVVALIACRHWHLPVPPDFWIEFLTQSGDQSEAAA